MEEEILYWEISDFTGGNFSLWNDGEKIYSQKITIMDIEKKVGKKIKVCPKDENPNYIVEAKVTHNGTDYLDCRKNLRGATYRCYIIK